MTETVCGKVTQCWIAVIFAQRAAPNLSLILGGAGAKLEDMRQRIPRLLATARQANCAYSLRSAA